VTDKLMTNQKNIDKYRLGFIFSLFYYENSLLGLKLESHQKTPKKRVTHGGFSIYINLGILPLCTEP